MKAARYLCVVIIAVMVVSMLRIIATTGFSEGAGFNVWVAGLADPWQGFINLDLVTGLLLFAAWILYRERQSSQTKAWLWVATTLYWGNLVVAIYIYSALTKADGNWQSFFMGGSAEPPATSGGLQWPARLFFAALALGFLAFLAWGIFSAGGALFPTIGYLGGFVPLAAACGYCALRGR